MTDEDHRRALEDAYRRGVRDGRYGALAQLAEALRLVWTARGPIPDCTVADALLRFGIAAGNASKAWEEESCSIPAGVRP